MGGMRIKFFTTGGTIDKVYFDGLNRLSTLIDADEDDFNR